MSQNLNTMSFFPSFSSYDDARKYFLSDLKLGMLFVKLPSFIQQNLLDFCIGKSGLHVTYDSVFKRLFHPELHQDRLEALLSSLLGQSVHILQIIPREGTPLSEHGSFIIMDVLVILEDHSYADIEMQKIGYKFPPARADCYASDMIMRQYSKLKAELGDHFDFTRMNKVYCIVLMESSPAEFHRSNGKYLHRRSSVFDTGIYKDTPGLHEDVFICLDIFRSVVHNITKECSESEAWLTFLSATDPVIIRNLIKAFPSFAELYRELAAFMINPKELIHMFSEELYIMDRNTERLMVTELQEEVQELQEESLIQHKKVQELQGKNRSQEEKLNLLLQERDIFRLSLQNKTAEEIASTLHVTPEKVAEVLNS